MTKELLSGAAGASSAGQPTAANADQRVWVLRRHHRVTLRQAHAVIEIDRTAGLAWTSCRLGLHPSEITDLPAAGCMPCVACIAATPLPRDTDHAQTHETGTALPTTPDRSPIEGSTRGR